MIRSPIVYSGSKFSLLDQLLPLFPKQIDTLYDVFCGSLTVSLNTKANSYKCNDICKDIIDLYRYFKNDFTYQKLNDYITKYDFYNLSSENYNKLRIDYNKTKDPLLLYLLTRSSFNNNIRFNNNGEFNNTYGKDKASIVISPLFLDSIKEFDFYSYTFKDFLNMFTYKDTDFIYLDPPYLITNATYNKFWTEKEEQELLNFCKNTNAKFGISNVFEHKGLSNDILKEFAKDFNVFYLNKVYSGWDNASKNKSDKTTEVYICNYEVKNIFEDW